MIIGFALFKVKKSKEASALKHMKHHINSAKGIKGFIHGYVAKSMDRPCEYIVIGEYEDREAHAAMYKKLAKEAKAHPDKFISFNKMMKQQPLFGLYRKIEVTKTKLSPKYKKILKKLQKN